MGRISGSERIAEESILLNFYFSLRDSDPGTRAMLEGFLEKYCDHDNKVALARVHTAIAEWKLKHGEHSLVHEAQSHLSKARQLYQQCGHSHGELEVEAVERTHPADSNPLLRFRESQPLADRFFDVRYWLGGVRQLVWSISAALSEEVDSEEVWTSLALLESVLKEIGSEFLKQAQYIHSLALALLQAPEYGYALKSLESYLNQPVTGFGPINFAWLTLYLSQAYIALGNAERALESAKQALQRFEDLADYTNKSDAAFHVGLALTQVSKNYVGGSADKHAFLKDAISFLDDWAQKDKRAKYSEGEVDKYVQLAFLEDQLYREFSDKSASSQALAWSQQVQTLSPNNAKFYVGSVIEIQVRQSLQQGKLIEAIEMSLKGLQGMRSLKYCPPLQLGYVYSRVAQCMHLYTIHLRVTTTEEANDDFGEAIRSKLDGDLSHEKIAAKILSRNWRA